MGLTDIRLLFSTRRGDIKVWFLPPVFSPAILYQLRHLSWYPTTKPPLSSRTELIPTKTDGGAIDFRLR